MIKNLWILLQEERQLLVALKEDMMQYINFFKRYYVKAGRGELVSD